MNTIKNLLLILFAGTLLVSCSKGKYRKTKGGMPYQVFKGDGKDTQQIKVGYFIKLSFIQKLNDSVLYSTEGIPPTFFPVQPVTDHYDVSAIWTSLRVGDSIVATQMMDTFIKRNPQNINPRFKKGDKIITYAKVLGIYTTDTAAQQEYKEVNDAWLTGEIKTLEKYLAEKNITAQKTPSGAFVEFINPGTGTLIDSGNYVSVNYTGTSWSGKKFDSNTDPTFNHVGPMPFVVGAPNMIKGFNEAATFMRPGTKAKVYIPSVLAYAGQPDSPNIKPYEILIFEIEILDVQDKAPAPPQGRNNAPVPLPGQ